MSDMPNISGIADMTRPIEEKCADADAVHAIVSLRSALESCGQYLRQYFRFVSKFAEHQEAASFDDCQSLAEWLGAVSNQYNVNMGQARSITLEQCDKIERLRAERDEARDAARVVATHFAQSSMSPMYYQGVMSELEKAWPWLEGEVDE